MDPAHIELARTRGGYLRRGQLNDLGLSDARIRAALRDRTLLRVRHGTYVPRVLWEPSTPELRHAILTRSVLDKLDDGTVASHHSAASLHGLETWDVDLRTVHLTRLDGRSGKHQAGVVWHESALGEDEVVEVDGRRCVEPVRAAFESACLSGVEGGVVALSSVLRRTGVGRAQLRHLVRRFRSWAGAGAARTAATLADPRFESVGEARSFVMMWRHDVPLPDLQLVVVDERGRALGRVDFAWELHRHLGEFDGLAKYGRLDPWSADPGRSVVEEKVREDGMRATARGMSRWTWPDLGPMVQARTAARIVAALEQSRRQFTRNARHVV